MKNLNEPEYKLVWSDEFDHEGEPDGSKWSYDVGVHVNNELQYYTDGKNAEVRDGKLIITARKQDSHGYSYTSARLVSKNKGDWLYGRFDISAKLPSGRGTWPAIWMLPTDYQYGRWPASGEIDIMEHVGFNQDQIHFSAHTKKYNHTIGTEATAFARIDDTSGKFHKYSVLWLPDKLIYMVDDRIYYEYKRIEEEDSQAYEQWPFDKRFHIILNIAVGGFWGGKNGVDDSIFPQEMAVDYVRVYQARNHEEER